MVSWSLAAPGKRIAQAFHNLVDEFRSFGAEFQSNEDSTVALQMEKLQELDDLDPSDMGRICIAVDDAARCYFSAHWRNFFRDAIKGRFRVQAVIGVLAGFFAICF